MIDDVDALPFSHAPVNRPANPYAIDQPMYAEEPSEAWVGGIPSRDAVVRPHNNRVIVGWATDRDDPTDNPTDALCGQRLLFTTEAPEDIDRKQVVYHGVSVGDVFSLPNRRGDWMFIGIHEEDPRHMLFERADGDERLRSWMRGDFAYKMSMRDHPDHGVGIERVRYTREVVKD